MAVDQAVIERGLQELGQASPRLAQCLAAYLTLLQRWNRAYNLTAVRDPAAMVPRHLLDSLAARPWLPAGPLLDLGSGAGLPGLVIALAEPARPVTLLDSNSKKTRFLEHARATLGMDNLVVVPARAETWWPTEPVAVVTARAYAELAVVWRQGERFLAPGGQVAAYKGHRVASELAALDRAWVSCRVEPLVVPGLAETRCLVMLRRAEPVPSAATLDA